MPTVEHTSPRRRDVDADYYYRRRLGLRDVLPAVGIAIGAGLFAFYIAKLLLQRTPLRVERGAHSSGRLRAHARDVERTARR